MSKENAEFAELFTEFKAARGSNAYLIERYVEFIKRYAPYLEWDEYLIKNSAIQREQDKESERFFGGNFPSDFSEKKLEELLRKTYKHRSEYVHQGKQPPHTDPQSSFSNFFEIETSFYDFETKEFIDDVILNYNILLAVTKNSIINWLVSKRE
ncbi:hypothetical protein [Chryseobacterium nepalense]|uniref:Apea-like HEPN domain-containing protein n=1 Tax=Chryseobacterium nepalense TaxID=1854498 RepID=A0ABY4K9L2_9FLAO|nr:hypothetical protein [Chryseobacterium nepalense]UPQ77469.1 hypothetical protein M0D58_08020 [Chryseobacterium nepalense]